MAKRRSFSDRFKAAVALEALRGDKAVQALAGKYLPLSSLLAKLPPGSGSNDPGGL